MPRGCCKPGGWGAVPEQRRVAPAPGPVPDARNSGKQGGQGLRSPGVCVLLGKEADRKEINKNTIMIL